MGDEPELGPLLQRYQAGAADQRSVARVRALSAGVAALGSVLLLFARVPIPVFLAALLGLLMSLVWLGQARRAMRVAHSAPDYHLSVYRDGFVLAEGAGEARVLFERVTAVEVDEERLDIVAKLSDGSTLRIEPRYPGVAIHDLVRSLQEARQRYAHHVGTDSHREL